MTFRFCWVNLKSISYPPFRKYKKSELVVNRDNNKRLKWIVIIPPITRQTVVKLSCELSSPQSVIYQTSNWFENVQPQLKNKKFHDRWVIQTMLKPGDVLYLPSEINTLNIKGFWGFGVLYLLMLAASDISLAI